MPATHARTRRTRHALPCRGIAVLVALLPSATPAALPDESELFTEVPKLSVATRIEQSALEIPASVTVIDRAMIEATGNQEIVDLLRFVPGFQTAWFSGSDHAAAYHGQSARFAQRFQVLVNGRAPAVTNLGRLDFVTLGVDIEDIERIEVVRSPSSPSYGLDALLGVINIVTREPYAVRGSSLQASAGTQDTGKLFLRHGASLGALDLSASLSTRQDEGLGGIHPVENHPFIDDFGDEVHDDKEITHFALYGEYAPDARRTLEFELGVDDGKLQFDNFELPFNPPADADVLTDHELLRWTQTHDALGRLRVQFYRERYRSDEDQDYLLSDALSRFLGGGEGLVPIPPEAIPLFFGGQPDQVMDFSYQNAVSERHDLELQHHLPEHAGWRMVWGAGWRHDRIEADRILEDGDASTSNSAPRLFGNAEKHLGERLIANLGAHYEGDTTAGDLLSSRLGLNWILRPDHALRVSVAQGERAPSLLTQEGQSALYFQDGEVLNFLANSPYDLDPERVASCELGYVGLWPAQHLSLDVKLFREETRDGIEYATDQDFPQPFQDTLGDTDSFVAINGTEVDINGVEFDLRYRPAARDFVALNAGYAHAKGRRTRALNPTLQADLADETPEYTFGLLASKALPQGWEISGAITRVSDMTWQGDGDFITGHNQLDLRLARRFRVGGAGVTVEAIGRNIGNEHEEYIDDHRFEPRALLKLGVELD